MNRSHFVEEKNRYHLLPVCWSEWVAVWAVCGSALATQHGVRRSHAALQSLLWFAGSPGQIQNFNSNAEYLVHSGRIRHAKTISKHIHISMAMQEAKKEVLNVNVSLQTIKTLCLCVCVFGVWKMIRSISRDISQYKQMQ